MSLTVQREVLKAESVVARQSHKVIVDRELFLPEFEPEPEKILAFLAEPVRVEAKAGSGAVHITGFLAAEALYLIPGEDGRLTATASRWSEAGGSAIPFESTVELPGVVPGDDAQASVEIDQAGANPGGEHSLQAHLVLTVRMVVTRSSQHPVVGEMSAAPSVQLKIDRLEFNTMETQGVRSAEWTIDEELPLPPSMPDAARVIWWNARVIEAGGQAEGGALRVHGMIACEAIYQSALIDDGQGAAHLQCVRWVESSGNAIRFSRAVDWAGMPAADEISVEVTVRGAGIEVPDPRRLRLQARLSARAEATSIRRISVAHDCRSESGELIDLQRKPAEYTEHLGPAAVEQTIRETLTLPSSQPGLERVLTVVGHTRGVTREAFDDRVLVSGGIDLTMLFVAETGDDEEADSLAVAEWVQENALPFEVGLDLPGCTPGADIECHAFVKDISFDMVGPNRVQLEVKLAVAAEGKNTRSFIAIADVALVVPERGQPRASMIFYVVQPGETLWDIARRYNVVVSQLVAANGLDERETLRAGRKILIPRH